MLLREADKHDEHRKSPQEPSEVERLKSMIYSRIPTKVAVAWQEDLGLSESDAAAVLAWMQSKGGR